MSQRGDPLLLHQLSRFRWNLRKQFLKCDTINYTIHQIVSAGVVVFFFKFHLLWTKICSSFDQKGLVYSHSRLSSSLRACDVINHVKANMFITRCSWQTGEGVAAFQEHPRSSRLLIALMQPLQTCRWVTASERFDSSQFHVGMTKTKIEIFICVLVGFSSHYSDWASPTLMNNTLGFNVLVLLLVSATPFLEHFPSK